MAELTPQVISLTGLDPSLAAADSGGDEVVNGGDLFIWMDNADASQHTITIDSPTECDQGFTHDVAVDVPAGEDRMIGPFNTRRFNDGDGKLQMTYDAVTSVTVAAIRLPAS